jgi:hypothetical protein
MTVRTLHIGVNPLNLLAVMRRTRGLGMDLHWTIDGDGWESWGEAVGTDINDDHTLHLTSSTLLTKKEAKKVVDELSDLLMPMVQNAPAGTLGVLTHFTDWSEGVSSIVLARRPVLIENQN